MTSLQSESPNVIILLSAFNKKPLVGFPAWWSKSLVWLYESHLLSVDFKSNSSEHAFSTVKVRRGELAVTGTHKQQLWPWSLDPVPGLGYPVASCGSASLISCAPRFSAQLKFHVGQWAVYNWVPRATWQSHAGWIWATLRRRPCYKWVSGFQVDVRNVSVRGSQYSPWFLSCCLHWMVAKGRV